MKYKILEAKQNLNKKGKFWLQYRSKLQSYVKNLPIVLENDEIFAMSVI